MDLEDHPGAKYYGVDLKKNKKLEEILARAPKDVKYINLSNKRQTQATAS